MSLVDRVANRVSRQHEDEASTSLGLPISLLRHFPRELHLHVLKEVLREAKRLIRNITFSDETGATFLDYVHDDEHSARTSSIIKRRAQALIMFVGYAITPTPSTDISRGDNATTELVSLLVDLATIEGDSNISDIVLVTQQTASKVMNAIGAADFLNGALVMLQSDETRIKAGALEILAERIPKVTEAVRREQQETAISIIGCIRDVVSRQSAGVLVNSALNALRAIGSSICPGEESALVSTVPSVIKIIKARASLQSAIAVLPCYVSSLGPRLIPHFREIAQECTSVLQEGLSGKIPQSSVDGTISTLQGLVSTLPAFYGAAELSSIVKLHLEYSATLSGPMTGLMKAIAKKIPSNMLLLVLCDLWPNLEKSQKKEHVDGLIAFFVFFKRSLRVARRPDIQEHTRSIFSVFLDGFGVNMKSTTGSRDGEPHIISAFLELVVKLNETAFRPLFRRLYDWAFAAESENIERKVTFCHMYSALLDYFKGLMNPYMSMLLQALCDVLESLAAGSIQNPSLWLSTVETLTKSFENDDGVFWRDDKLASVAKPIIAQVSSCIRLNITDGKQVLTNCLIAMTGVAVDDSLLKSINLDLLMHTRAEDARERIFALSCSEALWREQGGKLVGFVAETATFISECAEDENDSVVRETHKLKNAVEGVAGSISGL
jgi:U3 small nucleolar RNA-associated protein 10